MERARRAGQAGRKGRMAEASSVEIRRELAPDALRRQMAEDVRDGLGSRPRTLPPKYFYDARGSRLFEAITRLPEYYQTRTERSILERIAGDVARRSGARAVVEYGSGSAGKTEILLEALHRAGRLEGYGPVDVSPEPLRDAAERLVERWPGLRVEGVVGDFETALELPFPELPRLVLFLGGTVGNLREPEAVDFLDRTAGRMADEDAFLIGFDLVKDRETLVAAYDDASGVTAEFNRNVLRVLNRELNADFEPEGFRHRAEWNEEQARIEMHLVAEQAQEVRLRALGMEVRFEAGETLRTELSHKYTRETATRLLERGGFRAERWETDPEDRFAVALARVEARQA